MCKKVKEIFMYNYGTLHLRINEILADKGISKNKICKDLDIPRSNFNRYCRDEFQRMDTNLICKLCNYLDVDISTLIEYNKPDTTTPEYMENCIKGLFNVTTLSALINPFCISQAAVLNLSFSIITAILPD